MRQLKRPLLPAALLLAATFTITSHAAFGPATGYSSKNLFDTSGTFTLIEGLDLTANDALVGFGTDLQFVASGQVQINQGPTGARLDWSQVTGAGKELPGVTLTMDETIDLAASGDVILNAFGFVVAKGTFDLVKSSGTVIDDGDTTDTSTDVTTFTANALTLSTTLSGFASVGASLSADPVTTAYADVDVLTTDAIGFSLSGVSIDLAMVQNVATPANK